MGLFWHGDGKRLTTCLVDSRRRRPGHLLCRRLVCCLTVSLADSPVCFWHTALWCGRRAGGAVGARRRFSSLHTTEWAGWGTSPLNPTASGEDMKRIKPQVFKSPALTPVLCSLNPGAHSQSPTYQPKLHRESITCVSNESWGSSCLLHSQCHLKDFFFCKNELAKLPITSATFTHRKTLY